MHRIVHKTLESNEYCSEIFLDVGAFDKLWYRGLNYKIKKPVPLKFFTILQSYLIDRTFQIRINADIANSFKIRSAVPQGSILGPRFYILFVNDIQLSELSALATFVDDTAIFLRIKIQN